jgi:hypothetical protein
VTLPQRNKRQAVAAPTGECGLINFPDAVANELQQKMFSGIVAPWMPERPN